MKNNKQSYERRVSNLENRDGPQDHEYNAEIEWIGDDIQAHYYKDGVEISEAQFMREASGKPEYIIDWGNPKAATT